MSRGMLFVAPWFEGGGIERIFEVKAPWFVRRGHRVELCLGEIVEEMAGRPNPILWSLRTAGIPVRRVPVYGRGFHVLQRAVRLAAIALRGGHDILVGHELMANLSVIVAKRLLRGRVRAIAEIHNSIIRPETGIDTLTHRRARALLPQADGLVAMSDEAAVDTAEFFGIDRSRIATIYNPFRLRAIRLRAAEPPARELEELGPYIVACGRLVKMKGFIHLIDAFALARREATLKLLIVGDGPMREELRLRAEEAGVGADVLMPGWTANPFPYFARARAFVLSSLYGESFSRVLVEAMICGVPVISSRCRCGPAEVLGGGRYGLLYEPGDAEDLARRLLDVVKNPDHAARRVEAAARRVEDFSEEKVLPQLEDYYLHASPARAVRAA